MLMRLVFGWTRSDVFLQQVWWLGQEGTFVSRAGTTVVAAVVDAVGGGIGYCSAGGSHVGDVQNELRPISSERSEGGRR